MNIYYAGAGATYEAFKELNREFYFLESYYYWNQNHVKKLLPISKGLFLDSGAYSAWSKGVGIDIDKYMRFIDANKDIITYYATLDSIGDPVQTLKNTEIMESNGFNPLPVFHYNEDADVYLTKMIDKYEYICLGGMVPISTPQLLSWLDGLWHRYLTNKNGTPLIKVHGFGQTSMRLLKRYPWYSVDSTSWLKTGIYGVILCDLGDYTKVPVTARSGDNAASYYRMKPYDKEVFLDWLKDKGYSIYDLQGSYNKRHQFNIEFMDNMCSSLDYSKMTYTQVQLTMF